MIGFFGHPLYEITTSDLNSARERRAEDNLLRVSVNGDSQKYVAPLRLTKTESTLDISLKTCDLFDVLAIGHQLKREQLSITTPLLNSNQQSATNPFAMLRFVKWLTIAAGLLTVSLGLITFWLPIPIGLPLLLAGMLLLVRNSSDARHILVRLMRRYPALRHLLRRRKSLHHRPAENRRGVADMTDHAMIEIHRNHGMGPDLTAWRRGCSGAGGTAARPPTTKRRRPE